jgi:hypothetical protein
MEISKFFLSFSFNFCKTRKAMAIRGVLWLEIKGLIAGALPMCAGGKPPYLGA